MRLIRVRRPAGVDVIEELLTEVDTSRTNVAEQLKSTLIESPEAIYFVQAYDGDQLQAFMIALAPVSVDHIFIFQAWKLPSADKLISDRIFFRVCLWADSLDRHEIRAETQRSPEAFLRKWNFALHSQIMSFHISENLEEELMDNQGVHQTLVGKQPTKEPDPRLTATEVKEVVKPSKEELEELAAEDTDEVNLDLVVDESEDLVPPEESTTKGSTTKETPLTTQEPTLADVANDKPKVGLSPTITPADAAKRIAEKKALITEGKNHGREFRRDQL